jgi:hypothetical protein
LPRQTTYNIYRETPPYIWAHGGFVLVVRMPNVLDMSRSTKSDRRLAALATPTHADRLISHPPDPTSDPGRVQENQLGQLVSEIPRPGPSTSLLSTPCRGTATFCSWLELQVTTDIPDLRALGGRTSARRVQLKGVSIAPQHHMVTLDTVRAEVWAPGHQRRPQWRRCVQTGSPILFKL